MQGKGKTMCGQETADLHRSKEICFEQVAFCWPQGGTVLEKTSFVLPGDQLTLLRGPSGAGKSTLLRLLTRLEEPTSGRISYAGTPLPSYSAVQLRRKILYLQQKAMVFDCPVRESLLIPFSFAAAKDLAPPADETMREILDELLLTEISFTQNAMTLSEGQKQRLCFARMLLMRPETLLLDEPTAALDAESREIVEELIVRLCRQGMSVIMITHNDFYPRDLAVTEMLLTNKTVEIGP